MQRTLVTILVALAMVSPLAAGNGNDSGGCTGLLSLVADLPYEDVDPTEAADAVFMREEEKLARDVYLAMDELWGLRVFSQIGWSEQSHMDALLAVLDKYGITDPVGDNPAGVFADPELQQTFALLLDQGSASLIDALVVGATIEDLDIRDLDEALSRADNLDLRTVYQNLQKGSRNHLRSFVDLLSSNGVTYEPQYLSVTEFEEIVNSPTEHGLLDADGEPIDCAGSGGGGNQPPDGPGQHQLGHQGRHQQRQGLTQGG